MPGPTQIAEALWQGDTKALPSAGTSQPAGIEATIEYNTVKINNRKVIDRYVVDGMDGFQGVGVVSNAEARQADHGDVPLDSKFASRTMIIRGRIEAGNIAKLRDMSMALRSGFTSLIERPLYLRTSNPNQSDIYINARTVDKVDIIEKQDGPRAWREFLISLNASDPRFYSVVSKTSDISFGNIDDYAMGKTVVAVNQITNPIVSISGGWAANGGSLAAPGNGITRHTASGTGNQGAYYNGVSAGGQMQVSAGKTYTASLKLVAFPIGRSYTLNIEWRDAANNVLDSTVLAVPVPQANMRYSVTGVAPANATQVLMDWYHTNSVNGDVTDTSEWMFCEGTYGGPFFAPGDGHSKWLSSNSAPATSAYMPRPGIVVQYRNYIANPTPQATTGYSVVNATSSIPTPGTIRSTATAGGTSGLFLGTPPIIVTAGQTYTFSVKLVAGVAGRTYSQQISWRNGSNSTISTSLGTVGTVANGSRAAMTAVAPAGATQAVVVFYVTNGVTGEATDTTEWAITDGASPVPTGFVNGDSFRAHWVGVRNASISEYFVDNYITPAATNFSVLPASWWLDSDTLSTGTGFVTAFRNTAPTTVTEAAFTMRFKTPPVVSAGEEIGITAKSPDGTANNMLSGRVRFNSATNADLSVVRTQNGTPADLSTSGSFAVTVDTTYWLKVTITTTQMLIGLYSVNDPDNTVGLASTLVGSLNYSLTGTALTTYGGTSKGYYGIRINTARSWKIGAFNMRSFSVFNADVVRVVNAGNYYAEPKIRFYGPMTAPVVTNQTQVQDEDFTRTVSITGAVPAGRYYEYDAKKGTLYDDLGVNKLSQLAVSSKPIRLRDGENTIGVTIPANASFSASFDPKIQFIYSDTWI